MSDLVQRQRSPFAEEFRAFAQEQAGEPLPPGQILFYGSSSIRLWETLKQDFAGVAVVNRGFGGSTLAECLEEMDWLVTPLQPRALVFYAGDNDLDHGASPEDVQALLATFLQRLEVEIGALPVAFISIKPSPSRFWNIATIRRSNELFQATCAEHSWVSYLDLFPQMLGTDGGPRRELYGEDGLHLNRAGYDLWTAAVRSWLDAQSWPG